MTLAPHLISRQVRGCMGFQLRGGRCARAGTTRGLCTSPSATSPTIESVTGGSTDKKLAVITGANTGIGFETAKALGQKGYEVVLACRDESKAAAAVTSLRAHNASGFFTARKLVLDDLSNVKDFVKETLDAGRAIDVLVNNAGVMACPQMDTKDGFEYQLGVNHLGHFVLTTGLLPLMTDSKRESRIVTVSSSAHFFGRMNFDDINSRKGYQPWAAYGQSKLANVMFAFELAKRLPLSANLTSNTLHPGVVDTELARYLTPSSSFLANSFVKQIISNFLKTPAQGAETSIYLATSPDVAGVTSKFFDNCKPMLAKHTAYDPDQKQRLWDLSCEMTGVDADVGAAVKAAVQAV